PPLFRSPAFEILLQELPHRLARKIGQEYAPDQGRAPPRLLSESFSEPVQELPCRQASALSGRHCRLQLAQLQLSKCRNYVLFARKIVEKGALADVRGLGDVLHGCGAEPALFKQAKCGPEEPLAGLRGAPLPATKLLVGGRRWWCGPGWGAGCLHDDLPYTSEIREL